jgi:repressor LexA
MLAEENREGYVQLPKKIAPLGASYFLLRVRGDSMNRARIEGESIEDGDLVLVRQQAAADPGQIVVALIDGQATIKRFSRGPGYCVLKPESRNPRHQPIVIEDDFRIQGVVKRAFKHGSKIITSFPDT